MKNKTIIYLLLVIVSFVWASSFIVVKNATREIDPIDLGFLRFLVATPVMFFILFYKKKDIHFPKKELPSMLILGATGVTLLYLFQYIGITYTTASSSAVLININVIFIAILSVLFLKEKISLKRASGIILSFFGVIIVVFSNISKDNFSLNNIFVIGSILLLLSAFCWAIYTTVGKRLLKKYDALNITTYAFAIGTLFYVPLIINDIYVEIQNFSINLLISVLYLAIFCSVFCYLGWYYAIKKIALSKAAVFLNLIPLFAIIMGIFLGERITFVFILGAIFIIYGVYLTQKS